MGEYRLRGGEPPSGTTSGYGAAAMMLAMFEAQFTKLEAYESGFKTKIQLYTGNPGAEFTENKAKEEKMVEVEITKQAAYTDSAIAEGRKNLAVCTWPEVSEAETYKWIVLRDPNVSSTAMLAIELTAPVAVVKGDTFVINIGSLVIKPKLS